jgi:protein gp37
VSCENQAAADERIPELLRVPASIRFLSCEPLLGPVDLSKIELRRNGEKPTELSNALGDWVSPLTGCFTDSPRISWVIVGGESGPGSRPMHPDWARSLRDQCQAAGVAFFFKQWGETWPVESTNPVCGRTLAPFADGQLMERVGKKAAGRLLDGRTWDEFPVGSAPGVPT